MDEQAVREWIAADLISYETDADGEPRIRVHDEVRESSPWRRSRLVMLDLASGVSEENATRFHEQLRIRRRERELRGLSWSDINPESLADRLAERLREVLPNEVSVSTKSGQIRVAGRGIDIARMVRDSDETLQERLVLAAESLLEAVSEEVSELTAEPWPARAGEFPGGFPPIWATITGGELRMGYGNQNDPIVELVPIKLADVVN